MRIVLLIFMLIFALKANESAASSSCDGDVNTCTPKQICEAATISFDDRLVWSAERSKEKFVNLAKELGMTCAVDTKLNACLSDPALCSVADLCLLATDNLGEKLNWATDQKRSMHVELAKGFGINCTVTWNNSSVSNSKGTFKTRQIFDESPTALLEQSDGMHFAELPDFKEMQPIIMPMIQSLPIKKLENHEVFISSFFTPNLPQPSAIELDKMVIGPKARPTVQKENVIRPKARPNLQWEKLQSEANYNIAYRYGDTCWINLPVENSVVKYNGNTVHAKRGQISLTLTANLNYAKRQGIKYYAGYPAQIISISSKKLDLQLEGSANDFKNVTDLGFLLQKKPSEFLSDDMLNIISKSAKGKEVHDTFSIHKLRAAIITLDKNCESATLIQGLPEFTQNNNVRVLTQCPQNLSKNSSDRNCYKEKSNVINKSNSGPKPKASHSSDLKRPKEEIKKHQNLSSGIDQQSITKKIQLELNRIGCNVGLVDGQIGPNTRRGLYKFSQQSGIKYRESDLSDENFLRFLQGQKGLVCKQTVYLPENFEDTNSAKQSTNNSAELMRLKDERDALYANLRATEDLIAAQKRAAEAPYRACLTNCALNNRAGKGVIAALNGMAQCNSSCAPLQWGGEVIPPSWERDKLRLRTVECMITRISRNQATASCR